MAVEDGVDGTDRGAQHLRIPAPEAFSDLRRLPAGILALERHDQRLDLHREPVGLAVRPPAPVGQASEAAVFVAGVDLISGFTGDTELPAEAGHRFAVEPPGNESEPFVHDVTLLPGHDLLPQREKVLPMSPE